MAVKPITLKPSPVLQHRGRSFLFLSDCKVTAGHVGYRSFFDFKLFFSSSTFEKELFSRLVSSSILAAQLDAVHIPHKFRDRQSGACRIAFACMKCFLSQYFLRWLPTKIRPCPPMAVPVKPRGDAYRNDPMWELRLPIRQLFHQRAHQNRSQVSL